MYCNLTGLIKCSLGHNVFLLHVVVFQAFFEKEIGLVGWEKKNQCYDPFLQKSLNGTVKLPLSCIKHPKRFKTDPM